MKIFGFWKDEEDETLPNPKDMVGIRDKDAEKIIAYLNNGIRCAEYLGYSYCRFECGIREDEMGDADLTDGEWYWPQGLSHYVDAHNVQIPTAFKRHMQKNNWKVDVTKALLFIEGRKKKWT